MSDDQDAGPKALLPPDLAPLLKGKRPAGRPRIPDHLLKKPRSRERQKPIDHPALVLRRQLKAKKLGKKPKKIKISKPEKVRRAHAQLAAAVARLDADKLKQFEQQKLAEDAAIKAGESLLQQADARQAQSEGAEPPSGTTAQRDPNAPLKTYTPAESLLAMITALQRLSPEELAAFRAENKRLHEKELREQKLFSYYPDEGPLRRDLYPKHLAFFNATGKHEPMVWCPPDCDGSPHNEVAAIGGNRTGKSVSLCYSLACHLIGYYAPWWKGRRFTRPITAWAAGEDAKAVRGSLQDILLGPPEDHGTGMIPKANIASISARAGVPDAVDTFVVKHSAGGWSRCVLKTYDQGRESFQAAKVDVVAFDEEPPIAIYTEGLTRTMSTVPGEANGLVLCAFTPLKGHSEVYLQFHPGSKPQGITGSTGPMYYRG